MKNALQKYHIYILALGLLLGFVIYLLFYFSSFVFIKTEPDIIIWINLHKSNYLLWLIDLIPILTILASEIIFNLIKNKDKLSELYQIELTKKQKIFKLLQLLKTEKYIISTSEITKDETNEVLIYNIQEKLLNDNSKKSITQKEDEIRHWKSAGIVQIGEILRTEQENIELLSTKILYFLIPYLNAQQGGIFLVDSKNNNLKLAASYSFNKERMQKKYFDFGEGLVGACAIDKKTLFYSDAPFDFYKISSGIGSANPQSVLIIPILLNSQIEGVIEIASFYKIDPYKIEFVENLSEKIATSLQIISSNLTTKALLKTAQEQSEILAQKEEELLNTIIEIKETQEKAHIQSQEFEQFADAVNIAMIRAECDKDGSIVFANQSFLKPMLFEKFEEVEKRKIWSFADEINVAKLKEIWNKCIIDHIPFEGEIKYLNQKGEDVWLYSTIVPKKSAIGEVTSLILLASDITLEKQKSLNDRAQLAAINLSLMRAELSYQGIVLDCNERFAKNLKMQTSQIIGNNITKLVSQDKIDLLVLMFEKIKAKNTYRGIMEFVNSDGDTKWFHGAAATVKDDKGEILKIIYIASDISEQKILEIEAIKQAEILKVQDQQLLESQAILETKLEETRAEMILQFKEIETIKVRNELTLEGMLDAILTFNQDGTIVFFNRAAEDLWGYNKKEIIHQNIKILFSENSISSDDFVQRMVNPNMDKRISVRQEILILTKDQIETSVLVLISQAEVSNSKTYTAFVQNIEMELF